MRVTYFYAYEMVYYAKTIFLVMSNTFISLTQLNSDCIYETDVVYITRRVQERRMKIKKWSLNYEERKLINENRRMKSNEGRMKIEELKLNSEDKNWKVRTEFWRMKTKEWVKSEE